MPPCCDTCDGRARLTVEDTGAGIAAEDQERIFEPFVQVGRPGSQHGTGLGLTITRQFVELMGGTIEVESTRGKGSRFCVVLPAELTGTWHLRSVNSLLTAAGYVSLSRDIGPTP